MNGIFFITGPRGVGKTTLAATFLPPNEVDKVFYHDSESSASRIVEELASNKLHFGHYNNLSARFSSLPNEDLLSQLAEGKVPWSKKQKSALVAYYEYIVNDLNQNMTPGKFKVYVHDTISRLEAGMVAWCDDHVKDLGVKGSSRDGSAWGEFWTAGLYMLYEQLLEAIKARGVETIILTSHLKPAYGGVGKKKERIPGKVEPGGKPWLTYQTSLMLWLVLDRRNLDGAPAALVLKERLGKLSIKSGEWQPRRMLPERLPRATWRDINQCLSTGCNLASPAQGEEMTQAEREMISEFINDEQMRLMVLGAEADLEMLRSQETPLIFVPPRPIETSGIDQTDLMQQAKRLAETEGIPLPVAIKKIKEGAKK